MACNRHNAVTATAVAEPEAAGWITAHPAIGAAVPLLELQQIDGLIRHWQAKAANPRGRIREQAMAEGCVHALQTVRAIHGLSFLEEMTR